MAYKKPPHNYIDNCKKAREARSKNKLPDKDRKVSLSVSLLPVHVEYLVNKGKGNLSKGIHDIVEAMKEEDERSIFG